MKSKKKQKHRNCTLNTYESLHRLEKSILFAFIHYACITNPYYLLGMCVSHYVENLQKFKGNDWFFSNKRFQRWNFTELTALATRFNSSIRIFHLIILFIIERSSPPPVLMRRFYSYNWLTVYAYNSFLVLVCTKNAAALVLVALVTSHDTNGCFCFDYYCL